MTKRKGQLLQGGATLLAGEVIVQCCGLLRNFLVARVIAPDQFGIAAALAMSVSLVEMLGDLGAGRFLTRAHDEDGDAWLNVAHGISVVRGALAAIALVLLAAPLASLMQMPEATWAFRMVGLVPLIRAFTHNQIWLAQRELRFKAFVTAQALPQVVTALAALPLAWWLRDFRALLWLLIANAVLSVALSHIVARKPYRLAFDREKFRRLLSFGLPLLGDGILMFAVLHGERIVIANYYGTTLLGAYSAAFLLAWTPAAVLSRLGFSLGVPQLASLRGDKDARLRQYTLGMRSMAAPALGLAILFGLAGDAFVAAIFGKDYLLPAAFAAWLGFGYAFRMLRNFPAVVAVADGYTVSPMAGNMVRVLAVGIAWTLAARGATPATVMVLGAIGEVGALVVMVALNSRRLAIPAMTHAAPVLIACLGFGGALLVSNSLALPSNLVVRALIGVVAGGSAAAGLLLFDPATRGLIVAFAKHHHPQRPMNSASSQPHNAHDDSTS